MLADGFLKGGSDGCSIVAYGDRWYDSEALRFFDDEPVRHKLLDLMVSSPQRLALYRLQNRNAWKWKWFSCYFLEVSIDLLRYPELDNQRITRQLEL